MAGATVAGGAVADVETGNVGAPVVCVVTTPGARGGAVAGLLAFHAPIPTSASARTVTPAKATLNLPVHITALESSGRDSFLRRSGNVRSTKRDTFSRAPFMEGSGWGRRLGP
jgi:hypothetical protein